MQFILQMYNRLCNLFSKTKTVESNQDSNKDVDTFPIFSIEVDKNYTRKISVYIPDNIDIDNVIYIADAYATAIADMSDSKIAKEFLFTIEKAIDKRDPFQKLLLDNIIYCLVYRPETKIDTTTPVVRPMEVFKKR